MEQYRVMDRVGEGTFGVVMRAQCVETGRTVALKKIRLKRVEDGIPTSAFREMKALQLMDHPSVVRLMDVFPSGTCLVFVFEYLPGDLSMLLGEGRRPLVEAEIKAYLLMLLRGVRYIHGLNLMHRDLKPHNLLMSSNGELKLGDFGLTRMESKEPGALYSHQVQTRWYRAPEILYGARRYSKQVDMWSVGCIFAEMLLNSPLFPGENDIDQLYRVIKVKCSNNDAWAGLTYPNADCEVQRLADIIPDASPQAIDLLSKFLVYSPTKRITAEEAMKHPYFVSEPLPAPAAQLPAVFERVKSSRRPLRRLDEPLMFPDSPGSYDPSEPEKSDGMGAEAVKAV